MYQAMYRKYRPKIFGDVFGQDKIVKTLSNAIKSDRISHAYIFYGPRGTGKTTIAKIFARAINCENNTDGNPCNSCKSCEISNEKECVDIIEIDAASNNGVDEIRELRKAHHRLGWESVSWCLETSLLKIPFLGRDSLPRNGLPPQLLCLIFHLLYFFLPVFEDNDLLFWVPDVLCQHLEVVLWSLLSTEMFF